MSTQIILKVLAQRHRLRQRDRWTRRQLEEYQGRALRLLRELRGFRDDPSLDGGAAHQVARGSDQPPLARAHRLAQRPPDLDRLAQRPQRLLPPGAWPHRRYALQRGTVARIYLPPDANCLLACADHCLRSRNYVNLIAIDKQPQLQWLDMNAAIEHLMRGASVWEWASNVPEGEEPDVVLACAGDIPTLETVAAAHWLREHAPELKVRVVNVVDLMTLFPREFHPHGMSETRFVELFTANKQVVFAFHGYQRAIHEIVHGQIDVDRFHVRGFSEQGTTTTPFDMVVLNGMSRYHLAKDALKCIGPECRAHDRAPTLVSELEASISRTTVYSREHLQDPPEIREWVWTS